MPRNKGTPNKLTAESRKLLLALFESQTDRIESALEEVYLNNKSNYMHLIIKILPYIMPKASELPPESISKRPLSWFNEFTSHEQ